MEVYKNSAAPSSTKKKELRIVMNDQTKRFVPNPHCVALLANVLPDWVPPQLYFRMVDSLTGHSKGMATIMTENLIKFMAGCGRYLTGIQHIDNQLLSLYKEIDEYAEEHNQNLDNVPF